jgi:electron transfer flavoprotein alpha subunit
MNQDILVLVEQLRGQVADITYILLAQARPLANAGGGKVVALLPGCDAEGLSRDLAADEVLYVDHPALKEFNGEAYTRLLAEVIARLSPRLALLGETTVGADVAGWVSARLELPLVSCCRTIRVEGSEWIFASPVCGGKLMAEGVIPPQTTLVTMQPGGFRSEEGRSAQPPPVTRLEAPALDGLRITLKQYVEPQGGDVDITRQPLLVAVGRGIERKDNLEVVQDLADALGGVVCATRPVVDQNWLPTSRLVGKSGKTVKPQVYLALGISGAPEHCEAITGSQMIIAINTDPTAPIFNIARYGATLDLLDLAPALADKARQAKGN